MVHSTGRNFLKSICPGRLTSELDNSFEMGGGSVKVERTDVVRALFEFNSVTESSVATTREAFGYVGIYLFHQK